MEKFSLDYEFARFTATLTFTPRVHFQMSGLGYLHPEWGHGMWKGESVSTRDQFDLPVPNPLDMDFLHVQTLSDVYCTFSDGREPQNGIGVLETLVLGPYQPAGFTGLGDGYKS
jgi:hypothetical protein